MTEQEQKDVNTMLNSMAQQRNKALDAIAMCDVQISNLQDKVKELEEQLVQAEKKDAELH